LREGGLGVVDREVVGRQSSVAGYSLPGKETMLGTLITLLIAGLVGLILISVVLAILGIILSVTFGLVGFLLFKVAPILLVGWVILKLVDRSRTRRQISAADQRWLDS
jgi:FtsH-binding integral membrane protein